MKKEIVIISVFSYLFISSISIWGANRVVELGKNIQTQVTASSAGDVVIIRAGEYQNQTISINQPIRLVREKGFQSWC